ncbi:hypothetical protein M233_07985 [Xylella fastidiosa subsp. multiplex Griffin-1]|nr:hypothetical protein M233_07985 [Xylella fastidiosa subsp. multiplex Griffin-1]TNV98588.1 hypothetical protein C5H21_07645 [Xylella fastidiosa]
MLRGRDDFNLNLNLALKRWVNSGGQRRPFVGVTSMLNGNKHIPRSVLALLSRESWAGARCRQHPGKVVEMNQGIQQRDCSKREGRISIKVGGFCEVEGINTTVPG